MTTRLLPIAHTPHDGEAWDVQPGCEWGQYLLSEMQRDGFSEARPDTQATRDTLHAQDANNAVLMGYAPLMYHCLVDMANASPDGPAARFLRIHRTLTERVGEASAVR